MRALHFGSHARWASMGLASRRNRGFGDDGPPPTPAAYAPPDAGSAADIAPPPPPAYVPVDEGDPGDSRAMTSQRQFTAQTAAEENAVAYAAAHGGASSAPSFWDSFSNLKARKPTPMALMPFQTQPAGIPWGTIAIVGGVLVGAVVLYVAVRK